MIVLYFYRVLTHNTLLFIVKINKQLKIHSKNEFF
jgi:hypothetical protein